MIPKIFLCIDHQLTVETPLSGLLAHQIDVVRRTGCECNMEMIWLWYDLIGFEHDSLDENEEKHRKPFTNGRK